VVLLEHLIERLSGIEGSLQSRFDQFETKSGKDFGITALMTNLKRDMSSAVHAITIPFAVPVDLDGEGWRSSSSKLFGADACAIFGSVSFDETTKPKWVPTQT
jgi:hypothetical protein